MKTLAVLAVSGVALAAAPGPAPRPRGREADAPDERRGIHSRAADDAWRIVGPGGGGTMLRPTISPHDPRVVVEGCDMTGAYVTRDGGDSWRMFNLGDDPKDANVIYAGIGALWRSEDASRSWRMVWPDPAKNTMEHGRTDHADQAFSSDDPSYPSNRGVTIHAIAVDPADSSRLHIAFALGSVGPPTALRDGSVVLRSSDRGRSWSRVGTLAPERVFALWVEGERVLALGETGAWESTGAEGRHLDEPAAGRFDSGSIARGPDGPILYGTTKTAWEGRTVAGGIHVSTDGGRTWRTANTGLVDNLVSPGEGEPPELHAISASARHGLTAYAGFRRLRLSEGPAGLFNGVAKTTDGGRTWRIVHREANAPAENMTGSWIEERARQMGVSSDGGRSWTLSNAGMAESAVTHVLLDPTSPRGARTLYACAFGRGLYKSTDDGKTWTLKNDGIAQRQPFAWRISRADDGTLYLRGPAQRARQDRGRRRRSALPFHRRRRALDEDDAARGHQRAQCPYRGSAGPKAAVFSRRGACPVASTIPEAASSSAPTPGPPGATSQSQHVYDTTVDPRQPDTLYACGFDQAAWRSADRGETWSRIRGFNFKWGHRVIPDRNDPERIYVTTFGGSVWHGPAAGDPRAPEDAARVPKAPPATPAPAAESRRSRGQIGFENGRLLP